MTVVTVTARGAARWRRGHPWIYRSDVVAGDAPPGVVQVVDRRRRFLGLALWSPRSEIRLRRLTAGRDETVDRAWWRARLAAAHERRRGIAALTTAYRVTHAEADGVPSLVVDRYGDYVVAQLLSAGLEAVRDDVLAAVRDVLAPTGVLLRNDASVRRHEGLPLEVTDAAGRVPDVVEVREGDVRYLARPRAGQKTGAFLDQRDNRDRLGRLGHGRALDVFTYEGLFALHLARRAAHVTAVDASAAALEAARANAALNAVTNVTWREADAFDLLRDLEAGDERYDTIVLDPPAFAKRKASVGRALAGYKEINLRAMRLLAPGGHLLSCSCSFHVDRAAFLAIVADAAADSGRRLVLERVLGQSADHPEIVTIPETGYLKGALLQAIDVRPET